MKSYKIPEQLKELSQVSGIYFLMHDGELDYIGRSTNIANRLNGHHIFDRHWHDEVLVHEIPYKEKHRHHIVENDLIKLYKPPKNIAGLPRGKQ